MDLRVENFFVIFKSQINTENDCVSCGTLIQPLYAAVRNISVHFLLVLWDFNSTNSNKNMKREIKHDKKAKTEEFEKVFENIDLKFITLKIIKQILP